MKDFEHLYFCAVTINLDGCNSTCWTTKSRVYHIAAVLHSTVSLKVHTQTQKRARLWSCSPNRRKVSRASLWETIKKKLRNAHFSTTHHHSISAGLLVVNSRGRGQTCAREHAAAISQSFETRATDQFSHSQASSGSVRDGKKLVRRRRYVAKCCAEQVVGLCGRCGNRSRSSRVN